MLATALPAAASWRQSTYLGVTGYVTSLDGVGAEGGVCGDPLEYIPPPGTCSFAYDQMFVNRYVAYSAPYAVVQTVSSTAYLYWYDGASNSWKLALSKDESYCRNLTGNGASYCLFGSSASDVGPSSLAHTPAFYNLPPGHYWTVVVEVDWWQQSTSQLLSRAYYYPTGTSTDIGCAYYAAYTLKPARCWSPYSLARLNLPAPTSGVGSIYMN
jgi:hypothetical protein